MKEPDWYQYQRAQAAIAQTSLTNSKRPECFVKGVYQTHLKAGQGPYVWDIEGHRLYDFICGMGSSLLGNGNTLIAEAIYKQAIQGITLSLGTTVEIDLAEKIKELLPWVEKMKFLKTGTEACLAALKIARAKTGRHLVLSEGYHGWSDEFISLSPPALGIPPQYAMEKLSLSKIDETVAAVIVEPVMTDCSDERRDWLRTLRQRCTECGVMLIFDEIITGFRTPKYTMSNYLGIEPDIICLGKAMAGGMPLSCVAGKTSVMNCGEYFVSSTFAGETCSMVASLSLIDQLQSKKFDLNELWRCGEYFQKKFNAMYPEKIKLTGYPSRAVFEGDLLTKALLWQEAYLAGILFGASWFVSFAHIPYMDRILSTLDDILLRIKTGSVALKGELPASPFAQKIREIK